MKDWEIAGWSKGDLLNIQDEVLVLSSKDVKFTRKKLNDTSKKEPLKITIFLLIIKK